jgi:ubiquinone biosynthesis protein
LHLIKEVRDVGRFNHILGVLFEEGFDFILEKIKLKHKIPIASRIKSKISNAKREEHHVVLRKTLEKLGPTFIKLGQILSVRPDLVPKEYIKELEKLQDDVEPFPYEEASRIIKEEFGKSPEHLFLHFEKKPIASASISQVHKAVLKTGETVAVKVQRPDIKRIMETDLDIMFYFAHLLENHIEGMKHYRPIEIIDEFKQWTEKELDFRIEARNAKRFRQNFEGSKTVYIPKIYDNLSSSRVLTLEFIDGVELHKLGKSKKHGYDFNQVMQNGFDSIMTQVFVHGIFHGDPHPGNIIVRKDNSIALIDFGIVGYFDENLKNKLMDLLYATVEQDSGAVLEALIELGMSSEEINREELKADIDYIIDPLKNSSIKEVKLSRAIEDVLDLSLKHKMKMPTSFVLFGKTIVTLEGIALEYDPSFKLVDSAKPFMEKIMLKRMNPLNVVKRLAGNFRMYNRFLETLPQKAERALDRIEKGSIKIDVEDTDIKKLAIEMDRSSNRISYGLLTAAFLVTSALLVSVEVGPHILGVPILSFVSFILACVIGIVLFLSILKERFNH